MKTACNKKKIFYWQFSFRNRIIIISNSLIVSFNPTHKYVPLQLFNHIDRWTCSKNVVRLNYLRRHLLGIWEGMLYQCTESGLLRLVLNSVQDILLPLLVCHKLTTTPLLVISVGYFFIIFVSFCFKFIYVLQYIYYLCQGRRGKLNLVRFSLFKLKGHLTNKQKTNSLFLSLSTSISILKHHSLIKHIKLVNWKRREEGRCDKTRWCGKRH